MFRVAAHRVFVAGLRSHALHRPVIVVVWASAATACAAPSDHLRKRIVLLLGAHRFRFLAQPKSHTSINQQARHGGRFGHSWEVAPAVGGEGLGADGGQVLDVASGRVELEEAELEPVCALLLDRDVIQTKHHVVHSAIVLHHMPTRARIACQRV